MGRQSRRNFPWPLGIIALIFIVLLIPFTVGKGGDNNVLSDRLATAEFIISLLIAMGLIYRRRRNFHKR